MHQYVGANELSKTIRKFDTFMPLASIRYILTNIWIYFNKKVAKYRQPVTVIKYSIEIS